MAYPVTSRRTDNGVPVHKDDVQPTDPPPAPLARHAARLRRILNHSFWGLVAVLWQQLWAAGEGTARADASTCTNTCNQSNQIQKDPDQIPKDLALSHVVDPTKSQRIPTRPQRIPTTSQRIPTTSQRIPAKSQKIRTTSQRIPTRSQKIPTRSHRIPTRFQQIPTRSQRITTRSQRIPNQIATDFNQSPKNPNQIPKDSKQIPKDPNQITRTCIAYTPDDIYIYIYKYVYN